MSVRPSTLLIVFQCSRTTFEEIRKDDHRLCLKSAMSASDGARMTKVPDSTPAEAGAETDLPWTPPGMQGIRDAHFAQARALEIILLELTSKQQSSITALQREVEAIAARQSGNLGRISNEVQANTGATIMTIPSAPVDTCKSLAAASATSNLGLENLSDRGGEDSNESFVCPATLDTNIEVNSGSGLVHQGGGNLITPVYPLVTRSTTTAGKE